MSASVSVRWAFSALDGRPLCPIVRVIADADTLLAVAVAAGVGSVPRLLCYGLCLSLDCGSFYLMSLLYRVAILIQSGLPRRSPFLSLFQYFDKTRHCASFTCRSSL